MVWFQLGCRCRAFFPTTATTRTCWRQDGRSKWFSRTLLRCYVVGPTKSRRMFAAVPQPQEILPLEPKLFTQQPHQLRQLVEPKLQQNTLQPQLLQEQQQQPQIELQSNQSQQPDQRLEQPDKEDFECEKPLESQGMENVEKSRGKSTVLQCLASTSGSSIFREMDNYCNGRIENRETMLLYHEAGFLGAKKGTELIQKTQMRKQKRKGHASVSPKTNVKDTTTMSHGEIMKFIGESELMSREGSGSEGAKNFLCKYIKMMDEFPTDVSNAVLRAAISKDPHLPQELFDRLVSSKKADAATYESYVIGLLKCEKLDEALGVYEDMSLNNMNGSLNMYNMLLSSLCDSSKGDTEKWELALSIANEIRRVNVKPNTATFNSLMHIAHQQKGKGAPSLCLRLFSETRCRGCKPTLRMCERLLRSMFSKKNVPHLVHRKRGVLNIYLQGILSDLEAGNVLVTAGHPDDLDSLTQVMHISLANKNVEVARRLMNFVLENDLVHGLHVRFFNDYLRALRLPESSLSLDQVFAEYKRLVPQYYPIDEYAFREMLVFFGGADGGFKYVLELYDDLVSFQMVYMNSIVSTMLSLMNRKLPQNGRLHLLEIAENALSKNNKRDSLRDPEDALSGLLYLYCLCDVGEDKIATFLDYSEIQYGFCRCQLILLVFRTCLKYEEFGGATRAMQVILQDNMRSHSLRHTDVKLFGSSYMEWTLRRFRSDVMMPMDLASPASPNSISSTDSLMTFKSQFFDTIRNVKL